MNAKEIKKVFISKGLKATQTRMIILGCLLQYKKPLTIKELYKCVHSKMSNIQYTSLERSLLSLIDAGIIIQSPLSDTLSYIGGEVAELSYTYCYNEEEMGELELKDEELSSMIVKYFNQHKNDLEFEPKDVLFVIRGEKRQQQAIRILSLNKKNASSHVASNGSLLEELKKQNTRD